VTSQSTEAAPVTCDRCGTENQSGARYCSSCGGRLGAAESPAEERKLVSVLFVDLEGFTASSDRADPEDVRDLLESYHSSARECIEQYGGTMEKFIGDAVMAVFGAPVAHGDDAERAVRAGLAVLRRVESLELSARAAVNTGEAVVRVGDQSSGEAIALRGCRQHGVAASGRRTLGTAHRR
jgi:class 3 adenylate cyclase